MTREEHRAYILGALHLALQGASNCVCTFASGRKEQGYLPEELALELHQVLVSLVRVEHKVSEYLDSQGFSWWLKQPELALAAPTLPPEGS